MRAEMDKQHKKTAVMLIVPMLHQGGFERICAMTAKLLNQKYQVYLVVFTTKDQFYDVTGVQLIDLNLGARASKVGKLVNIVKRVRRVRSLKKKLGIRVSYSFGQTANMVNVLSKYHDVTWAGIRGYGALENKHEMSLICHFADRVVSCTKVMEQEIAARYKIKGAATIYNPCDLTQIHALAKEPVDENFIPFLEKEGDLIVSMGREDDVKCFWHLIKSVALLKGNSTANHKLSKTKLMIIGEGDYTEYKQLAKELGIADDVLFTGVQKNPFALLAKAKLYALTSESEGFPNALLEAMSLGVPCISVDCKTGPAEILQEVYTGEEIQESCYADYGVLMPVFHGEKNLEAECITKEQETFASELAKLLTNQSMWEAYHSKGQKHAQEFSMQAYQEKLEQLLDREA